MNLSRLAIKSLLNRAFAVSLTVITMALSVALIVSIEHIREEVRAGFGASVTGTDLVIGPRGSPLELILNAVFHIGNPNHALSWSAYQNLTVDSDVAWAIPIALGDSHRGFPVIATDNHYFRYLRYGRGRPISFQEGRAFSTASEVVLGSEVVSRYGYSMGDELELSHGVGKAAHHLHGDEHFVVVGILEPTGTPIDHTVHIPLEGMSQLHAGWIGGRPIPGIRVSAAEDHPEAINSVLIGLHQRTRVFEVQRRINNNAGESLTAVIPALVLEQLWRLVEPIQRVLEGVALLVFGASILGMASMMLTSLDARRRELSILRAVGAAPRHLFFCCCWRVP